MASYELVIHDDPSHSVEYVVNALVALGLPFATAREKTAEIDGTGRASLPMSDLATAQKAQETIFSFGLGSALLGSGASLTVSIERRDAAGVEVLNRGRVGAKGFVPVDEAEVARLHSESVAMHARIADARVAAALKPLSTLSPEEIRGAVFVFGLLIVVFTAFVFLVVSRGP